MFFGKSSFSQQSLQDLESLDAFGTLSKSGCDMAIYQEEIQRQRSNRSLSLRRITAIGSSPGIKSTSSVIQTNTVMLDATYALEVFNNPPTTESDTKEIQNFDSFLGTIHKYSLKNPRAIKHSFNNPELIKSFANIISFGLPEKTLCIALQVMGCLFPHLDKYQDLFVDKIFDFINDLIESPNEDIALSALSLITIISNFSAYGRDALLSLGTHIVISDLLTNILDDLPENYAEGNIEHVVDIASDSIFHIFANPAAIESHEILTDFLPNIIHILQSLNPLMKTSINSIIMTMVEMSNKYPSLVFRYYENELFPFFIEKLQDPDLVGSTLCIIGNCCGANPSQIQQFLDEGLIDYLLQFFETEYATDSFWIFSNLLQSIPDVIFPIVMNEEFIRNVISVASSSSFDLKKEASFLLSTIIINSSFISGMSSDIQPFITSEIFDIFTDMLSGGDQKIIERCINTFIKLITAAIQEGPQACSQLNEIVSTSDLPSILSDLVDDKNDIILSEKAEMLYGQLLALQGGE